jgi:hypothetical protein
MASWTVKVGSKLRSFHWNCYSAKAPWRGMRERRHLAKIRTMAIQSRALNLCILSFGPSNDKRSEDAFQFDVSLDSRTPACVA